MALIMPGFLEVYTRLCLTLIKAEQSFTTTADPFRLAAFGSFINLTPQPGVMLGLGFCSSSGAPSAPDSWCIFCSGPFDSSQGDLGVWTRVS